MGESGVLNKTATDLSPIKSSFLSANGTRYHLHPELIKICETTEMCCLCVLCLHLVDEEIGIGSINLNLPGAEVKLAKRDLSRQKIREKTMSIAAGFDYGVLSRVQDLAHPSILERILIAPHRAYYTTVKVTNPTGLPGSKSLKGDIICFTQDGPAEALKLLGSIGETMQQRIEWVRGGGSFRVILVDDKGNMENWLHDNSVLVARPYVVFNELRVRAKIDEATGNESGHPGPDDSDFQEAFVTPLEGLAKDMFLRARKLDDKHMVAVEVFSQVQASDIAAVRDIENGGEIDSVGLMSSSADIPYCDEPENLNLETLLDVMQDGKDVDENSDDGDDGDVVLIEDDDDSDDDAVSDTSIEPMTDPPTSHRKTDIIPSKLLRGSDPVYEFEHNGLNVLSIFRHIFPLMFSKTVCEGITLSCILLYLSIYHLSPSPHSSSPPFYNSFLSISLLRWRR